MTPTDAEIATQTLTEEGSFRFSSFSASDAVTLVRTSLYRCCPGRFKIIFPRAFLYESAFVQHLVILEARVW